MNAYTINNQFSIESVSSTANNEKIFNTFLSERYSQECISHQYSAYEKKEVSLYGA